MADEFHLYFPKFNKTFDKEDVVFSIGNIKSRVPSVCYMKCHCYDLHDSEILVSNKPVHVGERFVITSGYQSYIEAFEIPTSILERTFTISIELVLLGLTSENPCYFNEVMFEVGENHTEYHKPNDAFGETHILFNNNNYAVLYDIYDNGVQVIRPYKDNFTTKKLTASKCTILAPHLSNEPKTDTPSNIMQEFINQTEQYIQIKK